MINKDIDITIDMGSWPTPPGAPPMFSGAQGRQPIDVGSALLMLGTLTMPNILSVASPARYWAWIRYFVAVSSRDDLRVSAPFSDLDPHQKSVLSDDFGVATATQWLFQLMGGFSEIVDGRHFISNFGSLMLRAPTRTQRVGPSKSPDFVIKDKAGRWHVLECKGTQSGRGVRDQLLRKALSQKHVIRIDGNVRGERLAIGLALSSEGDPRRTQLKIIDPDPVIHPAVIIDESQVERADTIAQRLSLSRLLNLVGLSALAEEVALPQDAELSEEFVSRSEMARLKRPQEDRYQEAKNEVDSIEYDNLQHDGRKYKGRKLTFDIPPIHLVETNKADQIKIRYGVGAEFMRAMKAGNFYVSASITKTAEKIGASSSNFLSESTINIFSDQKRAIITNGELYFTEITLRNRS